MNTSGIRQLEGLLTRWPAFQRLVHRFFLLVYSNKSFRYLFQFALSLLMVQLVLWLLRVHALAVDSWGAYILGASSTLVALIFSSLPVSVVAYYERRQKGRDERLETQLRRFLGARLAVGVGSGETLITLSMAEAANSLALELESGSLEELLIVSPNLIYFRGDQVREVLPPVVGEAVAALAPYGDRLRQAIVAYPGVVRIVVPDPSDEGLHQLVVARSEVIGVPKTFSLSSKTGSWLDKFIVKPRLEKRLQTFVDYVRCFPGYRLMVGHQAVFFQPIPADRPGLCEPVYRLSAAADPDCCTVIRFVLTAWWSAERRT